jgi:organic hydroperoxide reductase OsmC/OhrA
MSGRIHHYETTLEWQGNRGTGTSGYRDYDRTHQVGAAGKPVIAASADPVFRGEADRWNPEELLVASLSQCHMLTYLHLAAVNGVVVVAYVDAAGGTMAETDDGGGHFTEVTLRPVVTVADASMAALAQELHHLAHERCFVASSVSFPVGCEPAVVVAPDLERTAASAEEPAR